MSALTLKAGQRLASATQVSAATDLKGAIAYLKKTFEGHGLSVKSITAHDEDMLEIIFKGPVGPVVVGVYLMSGNGIYIEMANSAGMTPQHQGMREGSTDFDLSLKGKKTKSKELNSVVKSLHKEKGAAADYAKQVDQCYWWMANFQNALEDIESEMDKISRAKPSRGKPYKHR